MFKLVDFETRDLTPELARQFMNMDQSPTERELNPRRVKYLLDKAEDNKLVSFHWAVAKLNGSTYRVNGNHSSNALCQLADMGKFPTGLVVHLDTYEVADRNDLSDLFMQFDAKRSSRSSLDVSGSFQGLHEDLEEVDRGAGKLAVDGIAFYRKHVSGEPISAGDARYSVFRDDALHPFYRMMGEIDFEKGKELKKPAVAAAIFSTFNANADEARSFWELVSKGGPAFDEAHPTTLLDAFLRLGADERREAGITSKNIFAGCLYAWNAMRAGRPIKDIKHDIRKGMPTAAR